MDYRNASPAKYRIWVIVAYFHSYGVNLVYHNHHGELEADWLNVKLKTKRYWQTDFLKTL
jgi:hypothetical protein